jgi:hypothetical protein
MTLEGHSRRQAREKYRLAYIMRLKRTDACVWIKELPEFRGCILKKYPELGECLIQMRRQKFR